MPSKDKYTEPELREQVKEEIREGEKGGAPGQWSASKGKRLWILPQMTATEYKKRGGGYTTDKKDKDKSQKHLDNWTEEEWQTKEGSGHAKKDDGTEQRYLPKKAWEQMNEKEKEETDSKKQKESMQGKQYVENTSKAMEARKNASKKEDDDEVMQGTEAKDCSQHWENAAQSKDEHEQYRKFKSQEKTLNQEHSGEGEHTDSERGNSEGAEDQGESTIKRGRGANQSGPNKKHKKSGSKDQARGTAGDKTRVPEVGQKVQWKSLPGFVDGEVIEVVYDEKKVDGKSVKGSKEDPRIVLKSSSSGKIAIHKPEAVYFD
ncbi:hypothetical protein B0J11DRAFT_435282 [Dendryphion nanum]|uniref:Hypervirulence associated protein TUDOR domain-containing protein n=1 Tax=Dendryphion nanum TaxID=256645 RepID=A0A9P9DRK4_9PLEO|nr:hypothetical protein B0J11DRAFT_435282 [Dendryphion nanum]